MVEQLQYDLQLWPEIPGISIFHPIYEIFNPIEITSDNHLYLVYFW